jgi:LPPG:FO 2-phospho-L-lactate transferase
VVVLAGGTGGAKLARGMLDVVSAEELVVIANTGDDIDIYGGHVSPDPDLVSFWLADLIDERGWGIEGDTFTVMGALRELRTDVWFNLGDRDLAWCLERRRMEDDEKLSPTQALARLNEAIGVRASVLPVSDDPLCTWVCTAEREWQSFQEFMVKDGARGTIEAVQFRAGEGADWRPHAWALAPDVTQPEEIEYDDRAAPSQEAIAALHHARAIIVGPSNPVISIWPILHVLGDALDRLNAPIVCVSPVVGGEIVKGPTETFLAAYGQPANAAGVVAFYEKIHPGLLDGIVADEPVAGMQALEIDVAMPDSAQRRRVAEQTLAFAESLAE